MRSLIVRLGDRFGMWTVIEGGRGYCLCRCDCGTTKKVRVSHLIYAESQKCKGCVRRTHGATVGHKPTSEYAIWASMIARCHNKSNDAYERYGGRGISVCDRWRNSFALFLEDMGPRPADKQIERVNNDGNYEPGNCRWATSKEQNRNRRDNRLLTYNEQTMCVAAWAERLGIKRSIIKDRLRRGWLVERALITPAPGVTDPPSCPGSAESDDVPADVGPPAG